MTRVLFVLKKREVSNEEYSYGVSTGLLNSASFVSDMLDGSNGVASRLVVVTDNNDIDRVVTEYKPTHAIIEALWVVPEKFEVLAKLHPGVKWIVRVHSETPFLANEGVAMDWIQKYVEMDNVFVGVNSKRFYNDIRAMLWMDEKDHIIYLPNYYPVKDLAATNKTGNHRMFDIGCFGAIRPLKNQLIQAMAAIQFAEDNNSELRFHINAERVEMKGMSVLRNLQDLFKNTGHRLVQHEWLPHPEFIKLLGTMDLCLQVSFSETFNIVAADSIAMGVPTVMSKEIPWAQIGFATPTDMDNITKALRNAWRFRRTNVVLNQLGLKAYVGKAQKIWVKPAVWTS